MQLCIFDHPCRQKLCNKVHRLIDEHAYCMNAWIQLFDKLCRFLSGHLPFTRCKHKPGKIRLHFIGISNIFLSTQTAYFQVNLELLQCLNTVFSTHQRLSDQHTIYRVALQFFNILCRLDTAF